MGGHMTSGCAWFVTLSNHPILGMLMHFDPDTFGSHGRHKESIAVAYKDALNGIGDAHIALLDNECISDLIQDAVHLTNEVTPHDTALPDAPSLHEALNGPE